VVAVVGLALGSSWVAFAGLTAALVGASAFAFHVIVTERRRHEVIEGELESLVESMGTIAGTLDPDQVLQRTLREAKELFGAKASLLPPGTSAPANDGAAVVPLRARDEEIGSLELARSRPLDREELARAARLARGRERAPARRGQGARDRAGAALGPADHG